jgi:hypothetical protein
MAAPGGPRRHALVAGRTGRGGLAHPAAGSRRRAALHRDGRGRRERGAALPRLGRAAARPARQRPQAGDGRAPALPAQRPDSDRQFDGLAVVALPARSCAAGGQAGDRRELRHDRADRAPRIGHAGPGDDAAQGRRRVGAAGRERRRGRGAVHRAVRRRLLPAAQRARQRARQRQSAVPRPARGFQLDAHRARGELAAVPLHDARRVARDRGAGPGAPRRGAGLRHRARPHRGALRALLRHRVGAARRHRGRAARPARRPARAGAHRHPLRDRGHALRPGLRGSAGADRRRAHARDAHHRGCRLAGQRHRLSRAERPARAAGPHERNRRRPARAPMARPRERPARPD